MKSLPAILLIICGLLVVPIACSAQFGSEKGYGNQRPIIKSVDLAEQNLLHAIELADSAFSYHFSGDDMAMARYYNPYTNVRSDEKGSVWMYTSAIEAVNAILHALTALMDHGNVDLYNKHFGRYADLLYTLNENADYYAGTFRLVSYTQTKQWTVHGVNRANSKGTAKVEGVENVYDDQQWMIREFVEAYKLTGNKVYLEKAEYLTEYVLDGWDTTRDADGAEIGGITWGPGYVTKHSCSNGPMVSPLVWLYELYKDKEDTIQYRYIDASDKRTRRTKQVKKSDYYFDYAKKLYDWQKAHLLGSDDVYDDMMGGCTPGNPETETIDGVAYRKGITCRDRVGPAISYNSGTMLSGAADLYRATGDNAYLDDAKRLSDASFKHFAHLGSTLPGYYSYDISGFNNWFNGVMMRGYVDVYPSYGNIAAGIGSFQKNLDYAYDHFLYKGCLPTSLLVGWSDDSSKNNLEGMFSFSFAAEYAVLAKYELEK
jgi:predicted alpha-1,6-mannanase (GH76 family)